MKSTLLLIRSLPLIGIAALLASAATLRAETSYHVSLDTTGLQSSSAAPFSIDFQLFDGAGIGNSNTTITLSNFDFGSGSAGASTFSIGGVSGSLGSGLTLTDSQFYNEFFQDFVPGSALQFDLTFNSTESNATPDSFAFALLDSTLSNLPTQAPGSDVFGYIEFNDGAASLHTYASNAALSPNAGGDPLSLPAPTFTAVPEPSTYGLLAAGLLAVIALRSRRRRT